MTLRSETDTTAPTSFAELGLSRTILAAVAAEGYATPTPVQRLAIPHVLRGVDIVALAQTGTGKTAAFALPIIHRLSKAHKRHIRALVLSPTRELASQIEDDILRYGAGSGVTTTCIFGGVGIGPQRQALAKGAEIVVATPGRLLDLMGEGRVDLQRVEIFVLDEADRMLDMGFIRDVEQIMSKLPVERQTLLFSATMPDDIDSLARRFMKNPVRVAVTPPSTTVESITQSVFFVDQSHKRELLISLLQNKSVQRALVFTRTKHGADRVAKALHHARVSAAAIHGNKSQSSRERALDGFKRGEVRVLVATDIAARGIDVEAITHVIQVDLPNVPEQYVHRIGRTARAGAGGVAWSLCSADERPLLRAIEREIRMKIEVTTDHPYAGVVREESPPDAGGDRERGGGNRPPRKRRSGGQGRGRGRGRGQGGNRNASSSSSSPPSSSSPSSSSPSSSSPGSGAPRPRGRTWSFRPKRR